MESGRVPFTRRYHKLYLTTIGLSNLGDWIYLIALNLIVFEKTESAMAVAALYLLKPLASLSTNFWAGTLIDRWNHKYMIIFLDLIRGASILILAFLTELPAIYVIVFFVNMASAVFEPSSLTYATLLIPKDDRQKFQAWKSFVMSGGFLIGPGAAGLILLFWPPEAAFYVNAGTFLVSGLLMLLLPDVSVKENDSAEHRLTFRMFHEDWREVIHFSRHVPGVFFIYGWFQFMMVMAAAVDSLEAVFAKDVLHISDAAYGMLVSVAGVGIAVGSLCNAGYTHKWKASSLLSTGPLFVSAGYLLYACSTTVVGAASGFFILSFSLAFANTGFYTFYQNHVPVRMMGRIASVYSMMEAVLIIMMTVFISIAAEWGSVRLAVLTGTIIMFSGAVVLRRICIRGAGSDLLNEEIKEEEGSCTI